MKIGIAQLNPTVGDFNGNAEKVITAYQKLVADGAELVLTGELMLCGYTPRDLLLRSDFVDRNKSALSDILNKVGEIPLLVGYVDFNPNKVGKRYLNAAAWCQKGKVAHIANKCLLPNYDVFDEDRYFEAAKEPLIVSYKNKRIGITLCEDIWNAPCQQGTYRYGTDPVDFLKASSVDVVVNLSASPWHVGKVEERMGILQSIAKKCEAPVVYSNIVGGNDELIFDGRSMAVNQAGKLLSVMKSFEEDLQVINLGDKPSANTVYQKDEITEIHDALILGLRDYAQKCHFKKAVLGLSGGIDSAVVASLAVEALGRENVVGIAMPSDISSEHSKADAHALAKNLGIEFHMFPISEAVKSMNGILHSVFQNTECNEAEENIQARMRGAIVMAMSNKFSLLALSTGNKSEMAVGYCTLYGDMCGGLGIITDVPKTKVYKLAQYMNREKELIPLSIIKKEPSAELRPNQKDQDTLPPYEILDEILDRYLVKGQSSDEIVQAGFEETTVNDILHKVDRNEYKRRQAAPGLKVESTAFGVGRRIPIVFKR